MLKYVMTFWQASLFSLARRHYLSHTRSLSHFVWFFSFYMFSALSLALWAVSWQIMQANIILFSGSCKTIRSIIYNPFKNTRMKFIIPFHHLIRCLCCISWLIVRWCWCCCCCWMVLFVRNSMRDFIPCYLILKAPYAPKLWAIACYLA